MKIIIEISENGLASLDLKNGKKQIDWDSLTRVEQLRVVKSLSNFNDLFSKHIKDE